MVLLVLGWCVCAHVCMLVFTVFIKRIALSYLQKRNDQREVCSMLPPLPSTSFTPPLRSLSPYPEKTKKLAFCLLLQFQMAGRLAS